MDAKDKKIAELEKELERLKANPAAKFYKTLVDAIDNLRTNVINKDLDLVGDNYQKSILLLADKSKTIFEGLEKGLQVIDPQESDSVKSKKIGKAVDAVPM